MKIYIRISALLLSLVFTHSSYQPVEKRHRGVFQPRQAQSIAPRGSRNSDVVRRGRPACRERHERDRSRHYFVIASVRSGSPLRKSTGCHGASLLSVSDLGISGLNRLWLVEVALDPSVFASGSQGLGGSSTVERALAVTDGDVIGLSRNGTDWPADHPGHPPFTASVAFGAVVDFAGDSVFASLGSEFFSTGDPVEVMHIETAGTGRPTVSWGGPILLPGTLGAFTGSRILPAGTRFYGDEGSMAAVSDPSAAFDTDGDANGVDFLLRRQRGFGTMGGALKAQGAASIDGNVDAEDFASWQTEYGATPPFLAVNAVPEPATANPYRTGPITPAAMGMSGPRGHRSNDQQLA